jgi:hypothetical protein
VCAKALLHDEPVFKALFWLTREKTIQQKSFRRTRLNVTIASKNPLGGVWGVEPQFKQLALLNAHIRLLQVLLDSIVPLAYK